MVAIALGQSLVSRLVVGPALTLALALMLVKGLKTSLEVA
jgi:hypothetical protein